MSNSKRPNTRWLWLAIILLLGLLGAVILYNPTGVTDTRMNTLGGEATAPETSGQP